MRYLILFGVLICTCYSSIHATGNFDDFLYLFPNKTIPFEVNSFISNKIDKKLPKNKLEYYLKDSLIITESLNDREDYYPVARFEINKLNAIIYLRHEYPGTGGYEGYYIYLAILDRIGNLLDHVEISCYCRTANMNTNELFNREVNYIVDNNGIKITEIHTHQNLFEEETNPKYQTNQDTTYYEESVNEFNISIDSSGKLTKIFVKE